MPNDAPTPRSLSDGLQDRLIAAGVTDDVSLAAALQRDPALAADLQAFAAANAETLAGAAMAALIQAFVAVEDSEQMMDFWRAVPAEMEEPFIEAVEALIAQAEESGDSNAVEHLRPRLEGFRQIHQAAQQAAEQLPIVQAVIAFVQAEDAAAAEALFLQHKALLQPYEAQQVLDALVAQAPADIPAEVRERLAARHALLRRLRGHAPASPPPPLSPSPHLPLPTSPATSTRPAATSTSSPPTPKPGGRPRWSTTSSSPTWSAAGSSQRRRPWSATRCRA